MTETDAPSLLVEREGPVLILTMNRPHRRNALVPDMLVRFADVATSGFGEAVPRQVVVGALGTAATAAACGWLFGGLPERFRPVGRGGA